MYVSIQRKSASNECCDQSQHQVSGCPKLPGFDKGVHEKAIGKWPVAIRAKHGNLETEIGYGSK